MGETRGKRIFATGISGSNRSEYLRSVAEYAKRQGEDVTVYHLADYMKRHADDAGHKYDWDKILQASQRERSLLVAGAMKDILAEIEGKKDETAVISSHARFYWKGATTLSNNHRWIQKIDPDMFVTVIDHIPRITERLEKTEQWKDSRLTIDSAVLWQCEEVNATREWAQEKPHYIVASAEPASLLYKLVYHPEIERVYVSFPMSHLKDENTKKRIGSFVDRLSDYFSVFNPGTIEIGKDATEAMKGDTFNRDLEWFISNNAEKTIVYFPKAVLSVGAITEMFKSSEFTKDTLLVAPENILHGPFESVSAKRFNSEEKLFEFLDEDLKQKGRKKWSEIEK